MTDAEILERARAALTRTPVFDGHNDLPWVIRQDRQARGDVFAYDLTRVHERGDTDIPRLREGMVGAQFWSAFQPTSAPHPARTTLELIDTILRIEARPSRRVPARAPRRRFRARAQAPARSPRSSSSRAASGSRMRSRRCASGMRPGARMLIPCHNETLDWVDSATDAPRHNGFNAFGRAVIGECNRLGMIVDGAHVSHDGDPHAARRQRSAGVPVALQRLFAVRSSAQRARRCAEAAEGDNGGVVMATFVPGFVSQPLRDWLKRSRDPFGKAPLAGDPKAQSERNRDAPRPGAEGDARTRSPTTSSISSRPPGVDHVGVGSDFFGGPQPVGLEHVGRFPLCSRS